jgi:hypothetical protein
MKTASPKPPCRQSAGPQHDWQQEWQHEWQPLFDEPGCQENVITFVTHRLGDYRQCARCGAIGVDEGSALRRTLLLSSDFAEQKKREALRWNAKQRQSAPK